MDLKRSLSAALAAALLLSLSACQSGGSGDGSGSEAPAAGVAVQVQEVVLDTISTENKVSGRVVTDGQESVFVAAQAQCTAVFVEAGDTVTAGQRICSLDIASTLSSYNAASIGYTSAVQSYQDQAAIFDSQIALAQKNVDDLKALFQIGAASQMEIDQAELSLQTAQAQRTATLAQLEAGMQSSKANVEQLSSVLENVDGQGNVVAPISGTVISLSAEAGGFVSPSMPVAVIDGVDRLEVDVSISALNTALVGTIKSIELTANMQTKLYQVTISIDQDVDGLLSGMFADVTFRTDTSSNTIVVPTEAVLTSGTVQYVFVVEGGDTARYREVTTGLTGNGVTEIASGLAAGDQLVVVGQAYVTDGAAVRIVSGEG